MSIRWYKKATVQASLINTIPQLVTALVAILAIVVTWRLSNNQMIQNEKLAIEQYKKDSLLVELQLILVRKELDINREELNLAVESKNLDDSIEKENLKKICERIWNKFEVFYEDNNPKPQQPLKIGESRVRKSISDLRLSYKIQNEWSKDLKELLYSGLNNKYLIQNKEAISHWKNSMNWVQIVIKMTDDFFQDDMSFKDSYNFDQLYQKISDDFFNAYHLLFNVK